MRCLLQSVKEDRNNNLGGLQYVDANTKFNNVKNLLPTELGEVFVL